MTDEQVVIEDTVRGEVTRRGEPTLSGVGAFDRALWDRLEDGGFTAVCVPEELGGSGGNILQAAAVVRGSAMANGPYAETFLAGSALTQAGIQWPGGVVTVAPPSATTGVEITSNGRLTGPMHRVPWLEVAEHVVVLTPVANGCWVSLVDASKTHVTRGIGANLAGEQRTFAVLEAVEPESAVLLQGDAWGVRFESIGAVARSLQICMVALVALEATIQHVKTRIQFGHRLADFQVVQHRIAEMATDVRASSASADGAVLAFLEGAEDAVFLSAVAKIAASKAVRSIATGSHQLHGAIGTTVEHELGRLTTRLWSWREEFGNERVWEHYVAEKLHAHNFDLWELVTSGPEPMLRSRNG